jgi:reactive intermediate/imine deaminase
VKPVDELNPRRVTVKADRVASSARHWGDGPETILSSDAFAFDSPYSPAIRWGRLLVISGQVAVDREGRLVGKGDIEAQTRQVFANLGALLSEAGLSYRHLVLLRYYLTDLNDWSIVGAVRREYLAPPYPAGSAIEVRRLVNEDWLLEIEGVAVLGD